MCSQQVLIDQNTRKSGGPFPRRGDMRIGLVGFTTALATAGAASASDKAQAKLSAVEWPTGNREYAKVHFVNPGRVGDTVLMGDYIIEHDNDRMARGQPCT